MRVIIIAVVLGVVAACNGGGSSSSSATSTCPAGWWVDSSSSSCSACTGSNSNPECTHADCVQLGFQGFPDGQTAIDGVLTYSVEAGTISALGPCVRRTYTISSGTIQISGTQDAGLSCSGDRLTTTYAYKIRPSAGLSAALDRALAGSATTFKGVAVQ